ncbi:hypothetical protein MMC18_004990 [Xylographa bjoerkii]|nr:hypothetical protein [Xylographa bjoerkii]
MNPSSSGSGRAQQSLVLAQNRHKLVDKLMWQGEYKKAASVLQGAFTNTKPLFPAPVLGPIIGKAKHEPVVGEHVKQYRQALKENCQELERAIEEDKQILQAYRVVVDTRCDYLLTLKAMHDASSLDELRRATTASNTAATAANDAADIRRALQASQTARMATLAPFDIHELHRKARKEMHDSIAQEAVEPVDVAQFKCSSRARVRKKGFTKFKRGKEVGRFVPDPKLFMLPSQDE